MTPTLELSMDGGALYEYKHDYDEMLTSALNVMKHKGVHEAVITSKMHIGLTDYLESDDSQATIPVLNYKISVAMNVKDERSGAA